MFDMFFSAWRYRFFIFSSIKTQLQAKFIRSRLGGTWMILHPLSQVIIFAFVLSTVMSAKLSGMHHVYSYPLYLMSGILCWSLFTEIVTRCITLFVENGNLLKKICFPKMTLPLIVVGGALVGNFLLFLAILLIFGLLGHWPYAALLWLPLLIIINVALAAGFGLVLGVLNVFIRDIGQVMTVLMQFLFWFTPIVYKVEVLPERYQSWLAWNPLTLLVTGYQEVLLYNHSPAWQDLLKVSLLSIALLFFALWIFRKASPEMADQL